MKVILVFCLLAIYGAVADDDTTDTTTTSSDSTWSIGGVLEKMNSMAQKGIAAKQNSVQQGVGLVSSSVNEVTDFASKAVVNGTALAQDAIEMGENMALGGLNVVEKIHNKTMDFVGSIPVVGKMIPTTAIKGVFSKGMSLTGKLVHHGSTAAQKGACMGGTIGKGVMGAVGSGATKVNDAVVAGDQMANAVASNMATATKNGISSGIKKVGKGFTSFGNRLTTSATLSAASSTDDKTASA